MPTGVAATTAAYNQLGQGSTRTIYINDTTRNLMFGYSSNYIRTTKFTAASFLPVALLLQFKRFANIFFLVIAILQSIPIISPLTPTTAILPLCFVLAMSMTREGVEDYARYKSDKGNLPLFSKTLETNGQMVSTLRDGEWKVIRSDEIVVGDMLLIKEGETFTSDLCILASSNNGVAYIQTSSLDGEKNLKKRMRPKDIEKHVLNTFEPDRFLVLGTCESEQPTNELYTYSGKITINNDVYALKAEQLLLKGSVLRNTEWCMGLVIFTGEDTKLMMNSQKTRFKQSKVEARMNRIVIGIIITQITLCIFISVVGGIWFDANADGHNDYLQYTYNAVVSAIINFFSYFLLLNTLLPISLIVTLEIVKVCQSFWIMQDVHMYNEERDKHARASAMSIVEELGQVNYIFSDKTGTLTRNIMEFKFAKVGNEIYGNLDELMSKQSQNNLKRKVTHTNTKAGTEYAFNSPELDSLLRNEENSHENYQVNYQINSKSGKEKMVLNNQREWAIEFLKLLALAHECMPESVTDSDGKKKIFYQGPSPDEVTLVDFARQQGLEVLETTDSITKIRWHGNFPEEEVDYKVFRRIEFNSDRKRMSILVQDPADGKYKLYVKGADSIILDRINLAVLDPELKESTETFLTKASVKGLRTLLMAMKVLNQDEFKQFQADCLECEKDILSRDKKLDQLFDKFERDLTLVGATAVEDRLQDDVPNTIHDLQQGGIKIWMLTGDKLETAENIGYSCSLFKKEMVVWKVSSPSEVESICSLAKQKENDDLMKQHKKRGILVEATALRVIFQDSKLKASFIKISKSVEAVVCCRVSPSQKADVVRMIKEDDPQVTTLSIGDGANDVSMILEAHIGIGLYGNEGMRAVQASDFAFVEFKFLWRLLLVHGRLNYLRNSELILYFFYKNIVFTLPHLFFAFVNGFSGQNIYDDYYITCYNMIFTALPLLIKGIFEKDIDYIQHGENFKQFYPELYYIGQRSMIFNWSNYFKWALTGILHSCVIYFVPYYEFKTSVMNSNGLNGDIWSMSVCSFTSIFFIVTLKLIMFERHFTVFNFVAFLVCSMLVYLTYMWATSYMEFSLTHASIDTLHFFPTFYLTVLVCVGFCFFFDLLLVSLKFVISPNPSDYLRTLASANRSPLEHEQEFRAIYKPIKAAMLKEDLAREQYLDKLRIKQVQQTPTQHGTTKIHPK